MRGKHVRIMIDNTTAVSCINHMGTSHSPSCNAMTQIIWQWCLDHDVWLISEFIPGAENTAADEESRRTNTDAEWMLDTGALHEAFSCLNMRPVIYLFASRLNKQMTRYVSFRPDPEAEAVDAFSLSWSDLDRYAFPPFIVIGRTLAKVQREKSKGVIVVPNWPAQTWWPLLLRLMTQPPVRLPSRPQLLTLPRIQASNILYAHT